MLGAQRGQASNNAGLDGDAKREAARITAPRAMKVSRLMVLEVRDALTVFSTFRLIKAVPAAKPPGTEKSLAKLCRRVKSF